MATPATHPLVREFLAAHRLDWSAHHVRVGTSNLNRFHAWCRKRPTDVLEAGPQDCGDYLAERGTEVAAATLIKEYQFLKWFYRWAHGEGELAGRDPMARIKGPRTPPHDPRRTPHVTEADYAVLMASFDRRRLLDVRNAAICSLMYRGGARGVEVVRADRDRLDLDDARLEVIGKSGDWETIHLSSETCQLLARYLRRRGEDNCAPLFVGTIGTVDPAGRLTVRAVAEMLARKGVKLGIALPTHAFRRAMAINAKAAGMNDTTVQHVGRWRDARMVARYQRNAQAELARTEFHQLDPTARRTTIKRRLRAV